MAPSHERQHGPHHLERRNSPADPGYRRPRGGCTTFLLGYFGLLLLILGGLFILLISICGWPPFRFGG